MKSRDNRIIQTVRTLVSRWHWWMAGGLLALMFGLGVTSIQGNSAIVDEIAHIPAGYSYLRYGDYRLNPEHPPLVKDFAGFPLQFMGLTFPDTERPWTTDVNGQWEAGWSFIYHIGNDADQILFWSRLPVLLLAVAFGLWLYWFSRRRWGTGVALMALGFYALSPNVLAHSTLVTTDLGATAFIFVALATFAWFVEAPSWKRFWVLSLALAGAQLAKFNAFLLYPFLLVVAVVLVAVLRKPQHWVERCKLYIGGLIGASAASMAWVWVFYTPMTWRMPQSVQDELIRGSFYDERMQIFVQVMTRLNDIDVFKPMVQYLLGLLMVFQRVAGGNVTYFNGQVSNGSFHAYFPELFLLKTQVALLILLAAVLGVVVVRIARIPVRSWLKTLAAHIRGHVLEWVIGSFSVFYFYVSVTGNLNLGIRHILPMYAPLFVLVAVGVMRFWRQLPKKTWRPAGGLVVVALLGWYGLSTLVVSPYFIPYFNELIGGPANADKYFSDSSVDWGQDLKRLKNYVADHPEITKVAIDYFGGGSPEYYFCNRKYDNNGKLIGSSAGYDCSDSLYEPWHSQNGRYTGQYIAVSETFLENDRWYAARDHTPGYQYLRDREPLAKIGYSIYLYKLY